MRVVWPLCIVFGLCQISAADGPTPRDTSVNGTSPQLSLEVREQADARVVLTFRAVDSDLDVPSLKCWGWLEAADGSRTPCPPQETRTSLTNGGLEGIVVWSQHDAAKLIARVEIRDMAHHVTSQEKSLVVRGAAPNQLQIRLPPSAAAGKPGDFLFAGMPRLTAAQMPAAGPSISAPSAMEGTAESLVPPYPADDELPFDDKRGGGPQLIDPPLELPAPEKNFQPSPAAEVHLRAARNSVALGNLPEALTRFVEYLRLQPDDHAARYEYAGLLLQQRQFAAAQTQLERLIAEQPAVGTYRMLLADLLLQLKHYDVSREQFRRLLVDPRYDVQAAVMLARSYLLEHRQSDAQKVYEDYLRHATDMTIDERRLMALLLVDMNHAAEAISLLQPLYEVHRDDEGLAIALVQAYVRANRRLEALELIGGAAARPSSDRGAWLKLAEQLYREQAFPEARAVAQQIHGQDPTHATATQLLIRTHLRLYEVDVAHQLLGSFSGDRDTKDFLGVLADYHTVVGDYSEAIGIGKRRLVEDPHDVQAMILLGNAYQASSQVQIAEELFQAALQECSATDEEMRREIRCLLAGNYLRRRLFDAARQELEELLEQQPTDVAARILLIETLIKSDDCPTALQVATEGLKDATPREHVALLSQLGYIFLEQGRDGEAAETFRALAADHNAALPEIAYGLYRSATTLKQPQLAREALGLGPSPLAPPASWGAGFADRALSYCDCRSAAAVLDDALKVAPANLSLLNRRGEAALLCDCSCGTPNCRHTFPKIFHKFERCQAACVSAMTFFQPAVAISPTNIRARLGVARTLKKRLEYEHALAEYKTLLKFMPQDVNLVRETARMVEGWKGIERSGNFYLAAQQTQQQGDLPGPETDPAAGGFGVGALVGSDTLESPTGAPPAALLSTELNAKYLRGWKFRQAIPLYKGLLEMEPTNEAALFDLAQSYSAINRTQCAIQTYQQLLDVNPCHTDAMTALTRNEMELRPKVIPSFDFQYQHGRQGLANITWQNYSLSERQPLGDENEYFEWGYRERVLEPTDDRPDVGEVPFMHWQEKYNLDSTIYLDLAVEQYQYGIKTRPTFNTGIDLINNDAGTITASGFLKNYYANGEAIRQDIYWGGVQFDALFRPLRLWTLSGFYRVAAFSDHNSVNWFNVNSAHTIMQGRKQLRGIIDYTFYSFAHQTIFGPNPNSLVGAQFPYWSPSGYSFVTSGLEWKQWLSCDTFKGGNERSYTLFVGGAVDSNGDGFFLSKWRWQHDFSPWVSWMTDGNLTWSANEIYNAVGVATYAVFRIP
ncbi:MAG TPA: tetratricopeptide repeat protein [Pirellulales bacterium]